MCPTVEIYRRTRLDGYMSRIIEKKDGNSEWLELCAYVEKEIFNYDDNQKLKRDACFCLRGLVNGKVMGKIEVNGESNYPFECILMAFKINNNKIKNAIRGKDFKNEVNKMKYICAIVQNDINDIYDRLNKIKNSNKITEEINVNNLVHDGANYQRKTNEIKNDKLNELW